MYVELCKLREEKEEAIAAQIETVGLMETAAVKHRQAMEELQRSNNSINAKREELVVKVKQLSDQLKEAKDMAESMRVNHSKTIKSMQGMC